MRNNRTKQATKARKQKRPRRHVRTIYDMSADEIFRAMQTTATHRYKGKVRYKDQVRQYTKQYPTKTVIFQ